MRTALISAAIAAAFFGIAACGATPTSTPVSTPARTRNDADVTFAQRMIPHHQQAVEMAELVGGRTENPSVVDLAGRIKAAQQPEIDQMTSWLKAWDKPTASEHSGHTMPGVVVTERLKQFTGSEFDRMWLSSMIEHHRGAVEMAKTEVEKGSDDATEKLAGKVIEDQQAEIATMTALLPQG